MKAKMEETKVCVRNLSSGEQAAMARHILDWIGSDKKKRRILAIGLNINDARKIFIKNGVECTGTAKVYKFGSGHYMDMNYRKGYHYGLVLINGAVLRGEGKSVKVVG